MAKINQSPDQAFLKCENLQKILEKSREGKLTSFRFELKPNSRNQSPPPQHFKGEILKLAPRKGLTFVKNLR
jgi:hypothetical protein